jgi:CubicO group peptidase (beta-lactamase class C family)
VWEGRQVLSDGWIQKAVAPQVSVRHFNLYWADDYGYLWWLNDYVVGGNTYSTYKALGWGGQEIWVVPDEGLVVVFTGANYSTNPPMDHLMTRYVFPSLGGGETSDSSHPPANDYSAQVPSSGLSTRR